VCVINRQNIILKYGMRDHFRYDIANSGLRWAGLRARRFYLGLATASDLVAKIRLVARTSLARTRYDMSQDRLKMVNATLFVWLPVLRRDDV